MLYIFKFKILSYYSKKDSQYAYPGEVTKRKRKKLFKQQKSVYQWKPLFEVGKHYWYNYLCLKYYIIVKGIYGILTFPFYSSFLRQPETTNKHDTFVTTSKPVCFTEEKTNKFREHTDKTLLTNDKYEDEVTLVDSNSLSKNTMQDNCLFHEQKYLKKYTWAYYLMTKYGYMCKICEVFFSDKPCPSSCRRGAWSHVAALLKKNLEKGFSRH